jgi:uncharacterized membrane protein YphA (DoxX/SURF4 family)
MGVVTVCQILVAAGLINVWVVRFNKSTSYRGGAARNLREEFAAYGLPVWFMWLIGSLKLGGALLLVAGLFVPQVTAPAGMLIAVLMVGALAMHVKVKDPVIKSVPAALMLAMSLTVALLN